MLTLQSSYYYYTVESSPITSMILYCRLQ